MLSFSISYWDLVKFHYFADSTEREDKGWKQAQREGEDECCACKWFGTYTPCVKLCKNTERWLKYLFFHIWFNNQILAKSFLRDDHNFFYIFASWWSPLWLHHRIPKKNTDGYAQNSWLSFVMMIMLKPWISLITFLTIQVFEACAHGWKHPICSKSIC